MSNENNIINKLRSALVSVVRNAVRHKKDNRNKRIQFHQAPDHIYMGEIMCTLI